MKEHPFLFTQDEKERGGDNKEEQQEAEEATVAVRSRVGILARIV